MAKLSKSALKSIVKECLVEILQEGIQPSEILSETRQRSQSRSASSPRENSARRLGLDRIKFDNVEKNKNFDKNIETVTNSMTDDPILSSILADTAKTTLQEQVGAETRGAPVTGGDRASMIAATSDPEELFGEASSKWANLAFASPITK